MLIKRQVKHKLYDTLHRSVVMVCMAVTVVSTGYLGYRGYLYFTKIKPEGKLEELKAIKEGKLADTKDSAQTLST